MCNRRLMDPIRAFYYQLIHRIHEHRGSTPGLRLQAVAILTEEFGDRRVADLADDELKWLNGKFLALLRSRGLAPAVGERL